MPLNLPPMFRCPSPKPAARARLAIFHHAGGSSLSFTRVARSLPASYEVWFAELPGRATRQHEAPPVSLRAFAEEAGRALPADLPLHFYGHSMGALLAYEAAVARERAALPYERLVVSCCRAPAGPHGPNFLHERPSARWTDEDLLRAVALFGPVPSAWSDPAIRQYALGLVRGDLARVGDYHASSLALSRPLTALAGERDLVMTPAMVEEWNSYTRGGFAFRVVAGAHFCVLEDPTILSALFAQLAGA